MVKYKEKMRYTSQAIREVIAQGEVDNIQYYILNLGTHPTAYVKIPENNKLYRKDLYEIDDLIKGIHGGITYDEDHLNVGYIGSDNPEDRLKGKFIGWDYAHAGDYMAYYDENEYDLLARTSKKWTTEELIKEAEEVARQVAQYNVNIKIDLEVGEYVRLKHWGISKCIKIEDGLYTFDKLDDECWSGDLPNVIYECELEDMIKEKSTKKINLLTTGDYVNGKKVVGVSNVSGWIYTTEDLIHKDHIQTIVTKEQFKAMEYKED